MFLIDKYDSNNLQDLSYYTELKNKITDNFDNYQKYYEDPNLIKNLNNDDFKEIINELYYETKRYINLQHLIIYGPIGSCKNYVINKLLENIYGKNSIELKDVEYTILGYSNMKTKITIKQSKHHIVIEPNSNGFDKYLIQEIIQEYAKSELLNILKNNRYYKIIIINKIDNLSYLAQASLRRTMEKYSNTCKFILVSDQLSKIIEPIRSRCILLRIPLATNVQILEILLHICTNENIKIEYKQLINIIYNAENKLKNAIWLLDIYKYNINYDINWKNIIYDIGKLIIISKNCNNNKLYNNLKKIREKFYLLFITNIPTQLIIKMIMLNILEYITDISIKFDIINITSNFEQRLNLGTRHIIHIEAYIIKLIEQICKKKNNIL